MTAPQLFLSWLSQIFLISWFNLKNLKERLGFSLVTVVGVAGVVFVFVLVLSIASGFEKTLSSTGDDRSVIVMRSGSTDEMSSGLSNEETRVISDAPGILRNERGPVASSELFVVVDVPRRSSGTPANVPLRGVSKAAFDVRGNVEIVEGRNFEPGRNEIIVGAGASEEFEGLRLDSVQRWGESSWTVVGIFSTGGTVEESEIWCDAKVLQPAYRRGNSYQSVHLRLDTPESFTGLKDALTSDPRLNVQVLNKPEYHAGQSTGLTALIRSLGGVIAFLMGFGAIVGALNTMYNAVSSRTREIATLRALGFGTSPVVVSVIFEAMVLATIGGVIGVAIAYGFNGFQTATLNWQTFSQVTFAFAVTEPLMIGGLIYAVFMGMIGGLLPAIRAARLPVATAIREL